MARSIFDYNVIADVKSFSKHFN